jgi:hypothetical protein
VSSVRSEAGVKLVTFDERLGMVNSWSGFA